MRKRMVVVLIMASFLCNGCSISEESILDLSIQRKSIKECNGIILTDINYEIIDKKCDFQKYKLTIEDGWNLQTFCADIDNITYYCSKNMGISDLGNTYRIYNYNIENNTNECIYELKNEKESAIQISKIESINDEVFWVEEDEFENWKIISCLNKSRVTIKEASEGSAFAPNITVIDNKLYWFEGNIVENDLQISIEIYDPKDGKIDTFDNESSISLYSPYFIVKKNNEGFQYESLNNGILSFCLWNEETDNEERYYLTEEYQDVVKAIAGDKYIYWYDSIGNIFSLERESNEIVKMVKIPNDWVIQDIFVYNEDVIIGIFDGVYKINRDHQVINLYTGCEPLILFRQINKDWIAFLENDECVFMKL